MLDKKAARYQLWDIKFKEYINRSMCVLGRLVLNVIYLGEGGFGEVISECVSMKLYYLLQGGVPIHSIQVSSLGATAVRPYSLHHYCTKSPLGTKSLQ